MREVIQVMVMQQLNTMVLLGQQVELKITIMTMVIYQVVDHKLQVLFLEVVAIVLNTKIIMEQLGLKELIFLVELILLEL